MLLRENNVFLSIGFYIIFFSNYVFSYGSTNVPIILANEMAIHVSLILLVLVESSLTHSTLVSVPHHPPLGSLKPTATPGNLSDLKPKSVKLNLGQKAIATNRIIACMYRCILQPF